MFFNFGVEDDYQYLQGCTSAELWCKSLSACIPAMAMCPYCPVGFGQYCASSNGTDFDDFMNTGKCCRINYVDYDMDTNQCMEQPPLEVATVESGCRLAGYSIEKCSCGPGCISNSRNYVALCPRCGEYARMRTGSFGKEECDLDTYFPRNLSKEYTLLVLPCSMNEFAFLDDSQHEKENADLLETENDSDFAPEATLLGDLENEDDTVGYLDSITNFYCFINDGEQCAYSNSWFDHGPNAGCWCRSGCCEGGRCVTKKKDWFGVPYCPSECRGWFGAPLG